MGIFDRLVRPKAGTRYSGPVCFSAEGPGGVPRHYAMRDDKAPDFSRPLIWVDADPESPDPTPDAHYEHARGGPSHMDLYHRREREMQGSGEAVDG